MLIYKTWIKNIYYSNGFNVKKKYKYGGLFLFGIIPLYIKRVEIDY